MLTKYPYQNTNKNFQSYSINEKWRSLRSDMTVLNLHLVPYLNQVLWHTFGDDKEVNSFTVSLHSHDGGHLPAVSAGQGNCQLSMKNGGNFHRSRELTWPVEDSTVFHRQLRVPLHSPRRGNPILHLDQSTHASYPTDSPTVTWLRLLSSLKRRVRKDT